MKKLEIIFTIAVFVLLSNIIMANDTIRLKVAITERNLTACMGFGVSSNNKNFDVLWGDGSNTSYVSAGNTPSILATKRYAEPGEYEVILYGASADANIVSANFNSGSCGTQVSERPINVVEMDLSSAPNIEYFTCTDKPNLEKLDLRPCTKIKYISVSDNKNLSELYVSGLDDLTDLYCTASNLTSVDLSGLKSIIGINFQNNKLTNVNLDAQTRVQGINPAQFNNNQLSLKEMRRLSLAGITPSASTGFMWQEAPGGSRKVSLNTPVSFADDTLLVSGVIPTNVIVEGEPYGADPDDYYTGSGSEITFLQDGYYELTLQHPALQNSLVLISYIAGDPHTEEISFDINEDYTEFYFNSNSGMAPVTIAWGDGDTSVYYGRDYVDHTYPYHGKWTVKMSILAAEFLEFAMQDSWDNNKGLTGIDLSQGKSLIGVYIYDQPKLDSLDLTVCPNLIKTEIEDNGLTNIKMTGLDSLEYVIIRNNLSLTSIDISGLSHLDSLFASNNKLTEILFDEETNLEGLRHCNFELNELSLPSIYKIYQHINPGKGSFAKQQLRRTEDIDMPLSLEDDTVLISAKPTNIVVSSNINEIEEGVDYTISGSEITFLNYGVYDVTLTHDSIKNADVNINYVIGSVEPEEFSFTFNGAGWGITLLVSSNADTVTIDWGDGNTSYLTGKTRYLAENTYAQNGVYTVNVKAAPGLYITGFLANDWNMSALDVSKAPSLTYIDVPYNLLTALDVSACKKLETLLCPENNLSDINFSGCKRLQTLDLSVNLFTTIDLSALPVLKRVNLGYNLLTEVETEGLDNLSEIQAAYNLLKLADLYNLSKTLRNYTGNLASTIGNFTNQMCEGETATTGEEFDLSSEALNTGGTATKINVMINDTTSATFGLHYTTSGANITFLRGGTYNVILTHDSIRYTHSVVIPFAVTGETISIEDIKNTVNVSIYPNPVSEKLFIRTEENIKRAEVYNVQGKLMNTVDGDAKEINVSDLKAGIYMLQITTESGVAVLRFIKQ